MPASPDTVARRSYLCGLKGHNGLPNKVVICDLETSVNNHSSDAIFRVWSHAGFPDEQEDIADKLDINTRSKMKIDCFHKMMQESLWSVEGEDLEDDGDAVA